MYSLLNIHGFIDIHVICCQHFWMSKSRNPNSIVSIQWNHLYSWNRQYSIFMNWLEYSPMYIILKFQFHPTLNRWIFKPWFSSHVKISFPRKLCSCWTVWGTPMLHKLCNFSKEIFCAPLLHDLMTKFFWNQISPFLT